MEDCKRRTSKGREKYWSLKSRHLVKKLINKGISLYIYVSRINEEVLYPRETEIKMGTTGYEKCHTGRKKGRQWDEIEGDDRDRWGDFGCQATFLGWERLREKNESLSVPFSVTLTEYKYLATRESYYFTFAILIHPRLHSTGLLLYGTCIFGMS